MSPRPSLSYTLLDAISRAAAWAISRKRDLVYLRISDADCEEAGLPEGTFETDAAITVWEQVRKGWRFGCWLHDDNENPEGCLCIDLFRARAEVFYYRKGHDHASSQAHAKARFVARRAIEEAAWSSRASDMQNCAA